jgi:hypothetical protein
MLTCKCQLYNLELRLGSFEGLAVENRNVTVFGSNPDKAVGFSV